MVNRQLCNRLARIIGGSGSITNGACVVQTLRKLNVKIFGRHDRSSYPAVRTVRGSQGRQKPYLEPGGNRHPGKRNQPLRLGGAQARHQSNRHSQPLAIPKPLF